MKDAVSQGRGDERDCARALEWARVLVEHEPRYLAARKAFADALLRETVRRTGSALAASRELRMHRCTAARLRRASVDAWQALSGPQREAVRQAAAALAGNTYQEAKRTFARMVSRAAIEVARMRKGRPEGATKRVGSAAGQLIQVHRNSIRRMSKQG